MHKIVGEHTKEYIKASPDMRKFFERLVNANKKLFLVTNSPFIFVYVYIRRFVFFEFILTNNNLSRNKGMQYLVGNDWRDLFDVVIVQARKPMFFTEDSRPLR